MTRVESLVGHGTFVLQQQRAATGVDREEGGDVVDAAVDRHLVRVRLRLRVRARVWVGVRVWVWVGVRIRVRVS